MKLASKHQRIFFLILLLAVVAGMGIIVLPLWRFLVLGGIAGVLLVPFRRWLQKRVRFRTGIVSGLVYVTFLGAIIIPFILILVMSGNQADNLAQSSATHSGSGLLDALVQQIGQSLGLNAQQLVQQVEAWLRESWVLLFATIAADIAEFIGTALEFFVSFVLFSFFLVIFMHYYEPVRALLLKLTPLPVAISGHYLHKSRLMSRDVLVGVFGVAAVQTVIMTVTFALVGIPNALAYLIPIYLFTLIPFLGMGLVTIPMGVFLILQGHLGAALVIWLVHFLAINNVELVLRPLIISKEVRINRAFLATSFFGGMAVFGLIGLFIGPILAILLVISLEIYVDNFVAPIESVLTNHNG